MKDAIDFLAKQAQKGRLNYAEALAKKRPIGTGVVEAAEETVVGVRIKRAGSRSRLFPTRSSAESSRWRLRERRGTCGRWSA